MKKIILLLLALVNFGFGSVISNAQTEVFEFIMADDWQLNNGNRDYCLCVLDGDKGKLQLLHHQKSGERITYNAYAYSYSDHVTLKLYPYDKDFSNASVYLYPGGGSYCATEYGNLIITEVNIIPQNYWDYKIAEYGMTYECQSMAYASSNSSSGSYNSNSYNSNNSNTYNNSSSSGSELGKAFLIGAGFVAAGVAIYDAVTNSSSKSSSNNQKNGFEITKVNISRESMKQSNGSTKYFDHAEVYYKNNNSYSVKVVLRVNLTDGSSFNTQKMVIDPYENDSEGWNSWEKRIKGVEIYSVEKAY